MCQNKIMEQNRSGFSIIEIVVALVLVSMVTLLLGSLGTQVANYMKSGRQRAAILEISSKTNSILRNPTKWMRTLRGSALTQATFDKCMPDQISA